MFTFLLQAGMLAGQRTVQCNGTMTTFRVLSYLACVWPKPPTTSSALLRFSQIWSPPASQRPSCPPAYPHWWWLGRQSCRWERWAPGEILSGLSDLPLCSSQSFTDCVTADTGTLTQVIIVPGFNTSSLTPVFISKC